MARNNKDSYYLFRQSPSDQEIKKKSIQEGNIKIIEDERIRMPNYSQKKLLNKLKVMGNKHDADEQFSARPKSYFNAAQRSPNAQRGDGQEIGSKINKVIS